MNDESIQSPPPTETNNLKPLIGKEATIADGSILDGMSGPIRLVGHYDGQPAVWIELINMGTLKKFLHPQPLESARIE